MKTEPTAFDKPPELAAKLQSFASQNPAATISIGYLALSLIGLSFTWSLFREFNIDYFEFADVTDFLMATLREPSSIGLVVVAGALGWAVRWISYKQYNWYHARKRGKIAKWFHMLSGLEWSMRNPSIWWFLFVVYCFVAINSYVDKKAERIRAGDASQVQYLLAEEGQGSELKNAMLLGTSARFVFVYDHKTRLSKIIPQESLTYLSINDRSDRDEAASVENKKAGKKPTDSKLEKESHDGLDE